MPATMGVSFKLVSILRDWLHSNVPGFERLPNYLKECSVGDTDETTQKPAVMWVEKPHFTTKQKVETWRF